MPTITDATVVAQAYDTSGNGGRKLVRLDNGSLVSATKNSTLFCLYKSTDGTNWNLLKSLAGYTNANDISIQTDGVNIFVLLGVNNGALFTAVYRADGTTIQNLSSIDSSQTAIGNVSLAINEAKTELHATWASKNSTYQNSFNIRYAKGTINADGTVTWGAVEQRTTANTSGQDNSNPSITVTSNGNIIIAHKFQLRMMTLVYNGTTWTDKIIYDIGYQQDSPSAIFVPQSINGLANGRIWVAWHGTDATDTTVTNIHVAYSDDLGVTWAIMPKITSGNTYYHQQATITANKNNEVFIVWDGTDATDVKKDIRQIKYSSGSWGSISVISQGTTGAKLYASTLFDLSLNFSSPLFIYKDLQNAKVGFYGTWTVTTISVTPGDIGQKTDKNNILSYSITTDGEMSTITEKINGTVVNTRNTTSGQAVTLGLTQAQWDAIRFGRYADATGGKNTLTVETGTDKWTYTFDKQLASDSDIISASKAVKDANEVYLPSVKKQLADAINNKGGSVSANADWLTMIGGLNWSASGRKASGKARPSASTSFVVNGLSFQPSVVVGYQNNTAMFTLIRNTDGSINAYAQYSGNTYTVTVSTINSNGFNVGASGNLFNISLDVYWFAFE